MQTHTIVHATTPPKWYFLSHHDRYRTLAIVRRRWGRRTSRETEDISDRTVHIDGRWIDDVPGFYLSLGEAINGPNGYFGGDLDALDDCLCGRFGVRTPLTVRLSQYEAVRGALDQRAACRFRAESFLAIVLSGDGRSDPFDKKRLTDPRCLTDFLANTEHLRERLADNGYLGHGSEADVALWTSKYVAALAGEPFDCSEYRAFFDVLLEIFEERGAKLVPESEEVNN